MKPCSAPEKLIDWHEVASDLVSSLEYTYGESASAQVVIVTCVYYVGVMTAYTPAICHGQVSAGSGHGDLG